MLVANNVLSFPSDPAYLEFNGISNILYDLLLKSILTPTTIKIYSKQL